MSFQRKARQGKVGHCYGILLLAADAARRPNAMLHGGRLFQQYVVDACAKVEQQ